ncbi:F-box/kelch-repeat protein At3g06240-like [Lycium ferocissimum]|uniref:F-box/kelch-repeat protein At3g06240-like n=1 Tax=Lycium ferocissimum TaxID=112874 RepID=UPI002815A41D|nr:F-box/kelch-repeat protein At3g06240-like [Lycium ferocissimum]
MEPPPEFPPKDFCTWGLGYDSTSDDYKILKIDRKLRSEILALKSGSWRLMDRHPTSVYPVLSGMDSMAFVNGAFHWLGSSLSYSVVSFSISNEVYGEIPLSEEMCLIFNLRYIKRGVTLLGEMLCGYSTFSEGKGTFKLWVMKDYGVKESWNQVFTVQGTGLYSIIPKYGFEDDKVLLLCKSSEPSSSVLKTSKGPFGLRHLCDDTFQGGFVYTDSFISLKLLIS